MRTLVVTLEAGDGRQAVATLQTGGPNESGVAELTGDAELAEELRRSRPHVSEFLTHGDLVSAFLAFARERGYLCEWTGEGLYEDQDDVEFPPE